MINRLISREKSSLENDKSVDWHEQIKVNRWFWKKRKKNLHRKYVIIECFFFLFYRKYMLKAYRNYFQFNIVIYIYIYAVVWLHQERERETERGEN